MWVLLLTAGAAAKTIPITENFDTDPANFDTEI